MERHGPPQPRERRLGRAWRPCPRARCARPGAPCVRRASASGRLPACDEPSQYLPWSPTGRRVTRPRTLRRRSQGPAVRSPVDEWLRSRERCALLGRRPAHSPTLPWRRALTSSSRALVSLATSVSSWALRASAAAFPLRSCSISATSWVSFSSAAFFSASNAEAAEPSLARLRCAAAPASTSMRARPTRC